MGDGTQAVRDLYDRAGPERNRWLDGAKFGPIPLAQASREARVRRLIGLTGLTDRIPLAYDFGTGVGVWAEFLSQRAERVIGLDFSEKSLQVAARRASKRGITNVEYRVANLASFEPDRQAALATCISVLQHITDERSFLRTILQSLHPGGHLVLLAHNSECIYNRGLRYRACDINRYCALNTAIDLMTEAGFQCIESVLNWHFLLDLVFFGHTYIPARFLRRVAVWIVDRISALDRNRRHYREFIILARRPIA